MIVGTSVYLFLCAVAPQWQRHADEPDRLPECEECTYVHLGAVGPAAECHGEHRRHPGQVP